MDLNQFSTVDIVLDKANDNFIQKQTISAGDRNGRSLTLQVTDAGSIGKVPGLTANLLWTNHSSGVSDLSAFSVVDRLTSVFKIDYPQNMLTAGKVTAQIQLLHNGKVTHSKKFEIIVLDIAGKLKGVLQTAEYTALVEALAKTNGFETEIAKKADNSRIDEIIVTPTEGISEQEIIDARKGQTSLRAKFDRVDDLLLSHEYEFNDLFGGELLVSPYLQWEQGSIQNEGGAYVDSDNRIRSDFITTIFSRETVFKIKDGYEFWLVEYDASRIIKDAPVDYRTELKFIPHESTPFIKLVVRRTGTPSTSSNTADRITPVDVHGTNIRMHLKPEHDLPAISEATDEMNNVNSYVNIEETDNFIEMDVSNDRNFYVDIVDTTEKHVFIRGLHKVRGNMISRVLVVNAIVNPSIKFPPNMVWQNDNLPSFSEGRTYMILLQSFNEGISWLGTIASSWKNKEYLVYDNFDKPDQLGLGQASTGQVWEYSPTSVWEIKDSSARVHTFRTDDDILSSDMAFCDSGVYDARVSSVVEERTSEAIRIVVRVADIHNYIMVGRLETGSVSSDPNDEYIGIVAMQDGVQSFLKIGTLEQPFKNGDTISAELEGNNIRAYHNGYLVASTVSSFNANATKHGIISVSDKDRIFHNFSVEVI